VLATFQYQLGVFGFLSLDNPNLNIPGNAQFRDHIIVLKWIHRHIKRFGKRSELDLFFITSPAMGASVLLDTRIQRTNQRHLITGVLRKS
jgi:Carboxylesterase family